MIRVEPGEDLVAALETLARAAGWRDGFVTGAGHLDLVELAVGSDGSTRTMENAELTALSGRIAIEADGRAVVRLQAAVYAAGSPYSGRILAAVTGELLLVVEAVLGDPAVGTATTSDGHGGSTPPPTSASPTERTPTPPTAPTRASDAPRSATKPLSQTFRAKPIPKRVPSSPGAEGENPEVEPGDLINHPQLGMCEVVGEDESGGTRIRVPSGRVRVLRLDALRVLAGETDEEGRTVFRVAGPRRRY